MKKVFLLVGILMTGSNLFAAWTKSITEVARGVDPNVVIIKVAFTDGTTTVTYPFQGVGTSSMATASALNAWCDEKISYLDGADSVMANFSVGPVPPGKPSDANRASFIKAWAAVSTLSTFKDIYKSTSTALSKDLSDSMAEFNAFYKQKFTNGDIP